MRTCFRYGLLFKRHYYFTYYFCTETSYWEIKRLLVSLRRTGAESERCELIGGLILTGVQATRGHWAYEIWADSFKTHPNLSYISGAEIKPAGHFSTVYIQSVTILNHTKTFGGDAWRVRVNGPNDLSGLSV